MEELSVDSSLAPDLVQFFNTKLKDARQALDKSQREIQDLQDEIAQLRQQKMDAFAMDVDDDANAAPDSEIEQELQRTRHALAGSNREVLELAHANLLLEEESARLRVQLGTQPLVHIEEHVKPLASCLDRFRAEEDIAKQLQELRANENRYEKKLQYVRKKLASLKEHAAEGSNMIYERDGPEISVKSMLNLPLSPLASDQDSGGEGEEENPDGENEPTRRVRFRDDGQIHETASIVLVVSSRHCFNPTSSAFLVWDMDVTPITFLNISRRYCTYYSSIYVDLTLTVVQLLGLLQLVVEHFEGLRYHLGITKETVHGDSAIRP
ncbi:uncharacterized protein PHACADRAFT_205119 [Phanerochaete carnosa HHB-10118-sp]|uniref:Uncharacterized protein n=1 Tax=Phanerochaete carnosa (strain HHB-10118-sp) TaxID=650164 RepID=K5W4V5_PHACS|nr:uncharacterized protein PHACADRAFT_205119 [Phanerochaete carnosa HHB-10118-sp]EKM58923.1 hypothetical protein PHACADRAFT_205119 [Phanerochaete carnosa HHB-10118-sp]